MPAPPMPAAPTEAITNEGERQSKDFRWDTTQGGHQTSSRMGDTASVSRWTAKYPPGNCCFSLTFWEMEMTKASRFPFPDTEKTAPLRKKAPFGNILCFM